MSRIGRYEVESELGRGSMGTVYLAYDPKVRRRVALKTFLVPAGLTAERRRDRQERFLREAQAAGALSHPAIVTIFEVDEDPLCDVPFIAMEYIPGRTLQKMLADDGPLPPESVRTMAVTLAGALQTAHEAGIVHRDVKPANVLVREADGTVKITDFGVARVPTSELTQSGDTIGSPAYMSPEQLRGGHVDGRSDLFSLAAILYELLCGRRPFGGEDVPAVTYSIVHEDPIPVTHRVAGLPEALDRFFSRALAKEPSDRYPNGAAFGAAFQEAVGDATAEPEAVSPVARARTVPVSRVLARFQGHPKIPGRRAWGIVALSVLVLVAGWAVLGRDRFGGPTGAADGTAGEPATASVPVTASGPESVVDAYLAPRPARPRDAWLQLDAKSRVKSGKLTVLVDGAEVYSRPLSTGERGAKRFFKKVAGRVQEEFEVRIPISPGKHEIVASVSTSRRDEPYADSVTLDLEPGESLDLSLVAGRTLGSVVSLRTN